MTEAPGGREGQLRRFLAAKKGIPASQDTSRQTQGDGPFIAGRTKPSKDRTTSNPISARNKASGAPQGSPAGEKRNDQGNGDPSEASGDLSSPTDIFDPLAEPQRHWRTGWSQSDGGRGVLPTVNDDWEDPELRKETVLESTAHEELVHIEGKEDGDSINTDLAQESAKKIDLREREIMMKVENFLIERGEHVQPDEYQYYDEDEGLFLYWRARNADDECFITYEGQGNQGITIEWNTKEIGHYLPGFDYRMLLDSNNDAASQTAIREFTSTADPMDNNIFETMYYFNAIGEYRKRVVAPIDIARDRDDSAIPNSTKTHARFDSPFHADDFGLVLQALQILEEKVTTLINRPRGITPMGG